MNNQNQQASLNATNNIDEMQDFLTAHPATPLVVPSDRAVNMALAEYSLSLQSDPRNTESMLNKPGVVESMRKDAMREALRVAATAPTAIELNVRLRIV